VTQFHQVVAAPYAPPRMVAAAVELRAALRAVGAQSDIAVLEGDVEIDGVVALDALDRPSAAPRGADVLVLHLSDVTPEIAEFALGRPERLVVIHHGTPVWEPYLAFDPQRAGRFAATPVHVPVLAERAAVTITSVPRNAQILRDAGFRNVFSTPMRLDLDAFESVDAHEPTMHHFASAVTGPVVLYAGPVDPHNRLERLVEAYHLLVTSIDPTAALVIAGQTSTARYRERLSRQINELNLTGAWLADATDAGQLAAFYRSAAVFASPGEPADLPSSMLSAMQLGVPVVALGTDIVRDAVGDAALLLPVERDPALLAEALAAVLADAALRARLIAAGRERVAPFDAERAATEWFRIVLEAGA